MMRLSLDSRNKAEVTVEGLYRDLERRIQAGPPGLCPVDTASAFLGLCHSQTCGKCVPCRIGLGQLRKLLEDVLDGYASSETINLIEETAEVICQSADCAIGFEAAAMVLRGLNGFRDDYEEHILHGRCICDSSEPLPCVSQCPAGVNIPGYIALIGAGRYDDAIRLIRRDNPFPAVCGLVCEHPCEAHCRRGMVDQAINIRGLKRYAVEHAGTLPIEQVQPATGRRVAVIGGGPCGLTAAYYLALMGHTVELFEQQPELGGMLRYGIPNYRLPDDLLAAEIDSILQAGITAHTAHRIDRETYAAMSESYDALYVAIGAQDGKALGIDGEGEGVISAVDMLREIGEGRPPEIRGRRVAVVGGGNVAIDAARSAVRLGAAEVSIVYRRRKADMPAMTEEIEGAVAEGCEIYELVSPSSIVREQGQITALRVRPQIVGPVRNGRPSPVEADQPDELIGCDLVISAIGQTVEAGEFDLPVKWGTFSAMPSSGFEKHAGIYAGGDCVSGPATVIKAIAAGKVAAANIDQYLGFHHVIAPEIDIPRPAIDDREPLGRVTMKERPVDERIRDFDLMEIGMSCQEARQEAGRCLRCDHYGLGALKKGRNDW